MRIPKFILKRLLAWAERVMASRRPDFIIGGPQDSQQGTGAVIHPTPYMLRWYVIRKRRFLSVYLHQILRSDDDRALHDHPWATLSVLLRTGYYEVTPMGGFWREEGEIVARGSRASHRLEVSDTAPPCISLFITGPVVREWGFHCPAGWTHWKRFVYGNGCGEEKP